MFSDILRISYPLLDNAEKYGVARKDADNIAPERGILNKYAYTSTRTKRRTHS
jgi:hypothetical protein